MSKKDIFEKINDGREYRNVKEVRALADGDMVAEGYATTFDEPYLLFKEDNYEVWEVVDRRAFDDCDMSDVIMQYDHEGRVFARISNGTLELDPDEHGLHVRAYLGGTEIGRGLYSEIAGGYTNKMSFGFIVGKDERVEETDREAGTVKLTRRILEISKLFDVSAVSLPANDATSITARSYGEGVIAEAKREALIAEQEAAENRRRIEMIKILSEV